MDNRGEVRGMSSSPGASVLVGSLQRRVAVGDGSGSVPFFCSLLPSAAGKGWCSKARDAALPKGGGGDDGGVHNSIIR